MRAATLEVRLEELGVLRSFSRPRVSSSPWLPLAEAARALHFPSSRALRMAIDRGRIPPQFVSATTGDTGKRRTLYVDVEGFASHLRNK